MKYYAKEVNGKILLFSGQESGNVIAKTNDESLINKELKIIQVEVDDGLGDVYIKNEIVVDEIAQAAKEAEIPIKELEEKQRNLRHTRDQLLKETDYIMMPDYPMDDKSEYEVYRQALRDLPETVDLDNPVFPTKPGS